MKCGLIAKELLAPAFAVVMTVSVGAVLLSTNIMASSEEQLDLTIPSACTMGGSGADSHTASTQGNDYIEDIGTTTLQAFCNDNEGFAIYAIGYTDNEMGKTVLTDSSLGSTYDIASGTATSGGTSNWAMKLAITQDANDTTNNPFTLDNDFGDYHTVPSVYTKVAHKDTSTDMTSVTGGVKLTTTYAAFASATQPAGTYTGQVKYTLVHPASGELIFPQDTPSGEICYYANTSTAVGTMGCQSVSDSATSATLFAPNFKREGYGFAGWSDVYDYSSNNNANYYGPNEDITFAAGQYGGENKGLSLYAVWMKSAGDLQGWTGCNAMSVGDVTALTDLRDNDTYAVAKLADGKCWMTENLRLADKDSNGDDIILSSTNTHNPSLPLTNTWWFSSENDNDAIPTSSHLSAATNPITTAWCANYSSICYDQSMLATNNTTLFIDNTSSNYDIAGNVYNYGNYYNWYSATAGHGKYGGSAGYIVLGDICPAGWHLPIGQASGEFGTLNTRVNSGLTNTSVGLRTYPNNFVYSGFLSGSAIKERSLFGGYWTASVFDMSAASTLGFQSTYVRPGTNFNSKRYGIPVRCLADV